MTLRLVGPDERAEVNVNGTYDKGFAVTVIGGGSVQVESEHFHEIVLNDHLFPLPGRKSVKGMVKGVERAKKYLQKKEDRLLAIQEAFNG